MSSTLMPALHSMPPEIKFLILKNISSTKSLYALIRASPNIHSFYLASREEILTQVVLNELAPSTLKILKSAEVLEFTLKDDLMTPSAIMYSALKSLCTQLRQKENHVVLRIDECQRIKWLKDVVGWRLSKDDVDPLFCKKPDTYNLYWEKSSPYHTIRVGAEWPDVLNDRMGEIRECEIKRLKKFFWDSVCCTDDDDDEDS